jgi:hypothetical protein
VLEAIDYEGKDKGAVGKVDRKIVLTAKEFLKDGGEEA